MNLLTRFKSLPVSSRRLLSIGMILALVVALPLFIWAVVTQNFNPFEKAATGEPGPTVPLEINEEFTGPGDLDPSKWNWSGYVGSTVTIQNNSLKVTVPAGSINVGDRNMGSNTVVQALVNYRIPRIIGAFDVSVDVPSLSAQGSVISAGLKFAPARGIIVRRAKITTNETHEYVQVLTSMTNTVYSEVAIHQLPDNTGTVRLRILKTGQDIQTFYNIGNGYALLTAITDPGYVNADDTLPRLLLENDAPNYPAGTAFFDNYTASATMLVEPTTPPPTPTAIPSPRPWNYCPGPNGTQCRAGYCQPVPSCAPGQICTAPLCADIIGTCQNNVCVSSPPPTCQPRPACLDARPPCMIPEPIGGWCSGAGECQMCGGFAGIQCQAGLTCQYSTRIGGLTDRYPNPYPDQSGICVKPSGSQCGTPPPTARSFKINFKFGGVSDDSAASAKVVVRFKGGQNGSFNQSTPAIPADYLGNGIYQLYFASQLPDAANYTISLKGEKHIAVRFCVPSGQTKHCSDGEGQIGVYNASGAEFLDFTGIPLEPGDLPPQDGAATIGDFAKIVALLTKPCASQTAEDKATADLDYSGCVNARDAILMRKTLETRYDEN